MVFYIVNKREEISHIEQQTRIEQQTCVEMSNGNGMTYPIHVICATWVNLINTRLHTRPLLTIGVDDRPTGPKRMNGAHISSCVVCIEVLLHPHPIGLSSLAGAGGWIDANCQPCLEKQPILHHGVVPRPTALALQSTPPPPSHHQTTPLCILLDSHVLRRRRIQHSWCP
jgi:hypothetical protein